MCVCVCENIVRHGQKFQKPNFTFGHCTLVFRLSFIQFKTKMIIFSICIVQFHVHVCERVCCAWWFHHLTSISFNKLPVCQYNITANFTVHYMFVLCQKQNSFEYVLCNWIILNDKITIQSEYMAFGLGMGGQN